MLYNYNIELGSKGISSDIVMDDGSRCLLDVISDPQLLQSFLESGGSVSGNVNGSVNLNNSNVNVTVAATTNATITRSTDDGQSTVIHGKSQHKIQFTKVNEANHIIPGDGKQVDHVTSSVEYSSPLSELSIDEKQQSLPPQTQLTAAVTSITSSTNNVVMTPMSVNVNQAVPVPSSVATSISVSLPTSIMSGALAHSSIALTGASISIPTTTPSPVSTPIPIPIRSPVGSMPATIAWPQQLTAQRAAGGAISVIPQQLVQMPGGTLQHVVQTVGGMQQVLLQPRAGVQIPGPTTTVPAGQLVQIIQTPQGAQIVAAPPPPTVQPVTTCSSKVSNSMSSSRSNKQILPKPPGSAVGGNSQSSNNSKQAQQQSNTTPARTVITNIQTNGSVGAPLTATSLQGATAAGAPQILIGPGGQQFIVGQSGPQGTFLVNQMVPGLNHQPFIIGNIGNIGNIQGPIQLTLRPQAPQVVAVSNASGPASVSVASSSTPAPLLSALTASTQAIQRTANQPQTYVIPQATSASAPTVQSPAMVMTAGHPGLVGRGQNLILTRPPGLIGTTSVPPANSAPQTVPHLLQIQTPNGPMLVALHAAPPNPNGAQAIAQNNQAPTPTIMPLHQQNSSSTQPTTLQTILTAQPDTFGHQQLQPNASLCNVATTNTVIYTQQTPANFTSPTNVQQQTVTLSASNNKVSQNRTQAKSVNLAELLKETGILPESSPPSSPTSVNQTTELDTTVGLSQDLSTSITQQQPTVVMVPSGHNQPNILLTQAPNLTNANPAPQLRLALAADGSVILQPNITPAMSQTPILQTNQHLQPIAKVEPHEQQLVTKFTDTCGPGSSQPSPDSTTPTLDITTPSNPAATVASSTPVTSTATTTTATNHNKSALLQQLNTAPAVKVPDSVATLALQQGLTSVVKEETKASTVIPLTVQNINSTNEQVKEIKAEVQKPQQVATQPVQHITQSQLPVNVIAPCTSSSAVIQLKSCDTFSTTASSANLDGIKVEQNSSSGNCTLVTTAVPTTTTATTLTPATSVVDQNGVSVVQISLNNQEFIERLETQIKSLSSLKAPTVQQKTLLQELLSLQKTMLEAKNQPQNQNLDGNVILTSQPQMLKQQQQAQQHQQQQSQQIQTVNTQQQPQNVHLVNLLNKTPVNQPQLRFLTPTNVSTPSNGSTTFQVGNQLITITTPAKTQLQTIQTIATNPASLQTQAILKPQLGSPATQLIQVVRLQAPSQTTQTPNQSKPKTNDTKSEQEKQKIKVCQFFQQQLNADQNAAVKPDVKHPFKNRSDACKKLLRYHVFNSRTAGEKLLNNIDHDFELISQDLLRRKEELMNRYRLSLLKLCLKESPTQEHIMLNKLFINEETSALKHDKELVLQGKELNLPPPPEAWRQKLRESFQEEEARLQINRKRKSSAIEDEFIEECQSQQIKKLDNDDQEANESDDEDEDSDDDDEDEEIDENTNEEMSKYLGPNVGDLGFLNDVGFSQPSIDLNSSVSCNHYTNNERTHNGEPLYTNNDWRPNSYMSEDRRLDSWSHRYRLTQNEDDVAVNTILDDEDDGENELEVDLTAIPSLDDNEEDEEEGEDDDDEEEEEEQDPNAIQMRCAINSILGNQQQFYNSIQPHTTSNNFVPQVMHSMYHSSRTLDFGSSGSQMMLQNDPVLDEAVKSILN